MDRDALLHKPKVAGVVSRDILGPGAFSITALPLYYVPQWRCSVNRIDNQLVAGSAGDRLAQTPEIWAGLRRQSRSRHQSCSAPLQQKGNADHGRSEEHTSE